MNWPTNSATGTDSAHQTMTAVEQAFEAHSHSSDILGFCAGCLKPLNDRWLVSAAAVLADSQLAAQKTTEPP